MELKYIQDASGQRLTVLEYQGRLLPNFEAKSIAGVQTCPLRADDVIICAYPKSGTHWMWEMVRCLLAGTTDVAGVEKDEAMMEFVGPEALEKLASPRPLNTHYHFEMLPGDLFKKKCPLIYITRDPRDVAVSYYNHHLKLVDYYQYSGQWKDYLQLFLSGQVDYESWFNYTRNFEQGIQQNPELPIFITSYEEFQEDTLSALQKLATFLGVSPDEAFLSEVRDKSSFQTMRATKGKHEVSPGTSSPIMYRKGKVGDWKNWFTVTQSEQFDSVFEQEMVGTWAYQLYSHSTQGAPDISRCA